MPRAAIDVVRDLYPAATVDLAEPGTLDGWIKALGEVAHPDFVGGNPREALIPMVSSVEEFTATWRDWLSAWESWRVEILGHEEGTNGRVLVAMDITGRSNKDSVEMPMRGANVVEVEDGRIKSIELYFEREFARRAAGLD